MHFQVHVARLGEHAVQRQMAFLLDAGLHLLVVGGEHDEVDVPPGGGFGLSARDQRDRGRARLEVHGRVVALPHHVFHGARTLLPDPLLEGPHLRVLAGAVETLEPPLPVLLDAQAELGLEAIDRFVTHQG